MHIDTAHLWELEWVRKTFAAFEAFWILELSFKRRREQICKLTNRSRNLWSLRFISSTKVAASSYTSTSAGTLCPLYLRPLKRWSFLYSLFLQHFALASWWHMRPSQEKGCKGKRLCFWETKPGILLEQRDARVSNHWLFMQRKTERERERLKTPLKLETPMKLIPFCQAREPR